MDCWYPITIKRRKRIKLKNGLLAEYEDGSRMMVPCGRCPPCRRRKQNEWAYRILEECKYTLRTSFVTLTYSDEFLPITDDGQMTLNPDHLHTFFKNLRYNFSFRYFACGEYGDKFDRPHYHFILFSNSSLSHEELCSFIEKRWTYGFIKYEVGVTPGRAKYCAKYSMKSIGFDYGSAVPPFARMSRRPGIGKQFLDNLDFAKFRKLNLWHVHDYKGTPYYLPRYYRDMIYSSDERDVHSLLLEKLKNSKLDYDIIQFNDHNSGNYFKSLSTDMLERERLFITHLKKENYGYKYQPRQYVPTPRLRSDDFTSDEF